MTADDAARLDLGGYCPVHRVSWTGHAMCPECQARLDAAEARVRELETELPPVAARMCGSCGGPLVERRFWYCEPCNLQAQEGT